MRHLLCLLWLLPVVARAQEHYHDIVFQRATGAVVLREGSRLVHIAPDDTQQVLPPSPLGPQLDLLLLSDGLWVQRGVRFGYFRPGPNGWSSGTWLVSRAFRASAIARAWILTDDEPSPVISGPTTRFHLRLLATESEIIEQEAEDFEPKYANWDPEVDWDTHHCTVERWGDRSAIELPQLPRNDSSHCPSVKTEAGRLWLGASTYVVAERGDGWRVFEKLEEPPPPPLVEPPTRVQWLERALPPLAISTAAGLLAAGMIATPTDERGDPRYGEGLARGVGAMITSLPSLLAIERAGRPRGAHDYSALLLYPLALLLSPLPAMSQAALGASMSDGAHDRVRGFGAAYGATIVSAAVITPLTYYLRARTKQHHWSTAIEAAVIGFASTVAYSYAAGL